MLARARAEQHMAEGRGGFGGVAAGLHAIRPETGTLHIVWPMPVPRIIRNIAKMAIFS